MPVDYDAFRVKPWEERITQFNAISNEEKAQLMRTHLSRWVDSHRHELSAEQLAIADEWLAFVRPELYALPKAASSMAALKELETRTASLFSREQMRDALTMHWDQFPGSGRD
jgi:hypothetical protein